MDDITITQSPYDNNNYRVITLQNGLQALLVQDPHVATKGGCQNEGRRTKMAAASMVVGVGSLHGENYVQGLPHLLEHMIGKGSRKFPIDFHTFISQNNGSCNANTTPEYTRYHFEVNGIFLKDALERFADSFIAPVLAMEILMAEVEAVNNEFKEKREDFEFIHGGLLSLTSIESHPYYEIFTCGNRLSLLGEEDNYDRLHKELLKFYNKYYIGKLMKLVVIGGESLDELEGWIRNLFKSIRCKRSTIPNPFKQSNPIWNGTLRRPIQSKENKRRPPLRSFQRRPIWKSGQKYDIFFESADVLFVSWTLPHLRNSYAHKPDRYISYFLEQEGNGSLFSLLKDRGLATRLIAGNFGGIWSTSVADIFSIEIGLTNLGTLETDNIIRYIYEYLALLRDSPPEWIYKEIRSIGELEFHFGERENLSYSIELSENLMRHPSPRNVISANHLYADWSEPHIKEFLGHFVPKNMRIDFFSNHSKMEDSKILPWFQIPFSVKDIEKSSMELWEQIQETHEPLQLPCQNEFIPNNMSISIGDVSNEGFSNINSPKCKCDTKFMKLWYKRSCGFKVPFSCVYLHLKYSKGVWDNIKLLLLSELFLALLYDKLIEVISKAEPAMFNIKLQFIDGMLEVMIFGLNEMLPSILTKILSEVESFMPTDERKYDYAKKNLEANLSQGTEDILAVLLREDLYMSDDQLDQLEDLSLDDLRKFIEEIRSQIFIEGLVHGSLSEDDANDINKIIKQIFPKRSPPAVLAVERVTWLTPNINFVENIETASDSISNAQLYIQIGKNLFNSIKLMALLDLFELVVKQPFFDEMRTERKLGYTVLSASYKIHNVWGFCFQIDSSEYDPYFLQQNIENFIDRLEEDFKNMDNGKFNNYRSCLVDQKLQSCSSLKLESYRVWKEITNYSCQFNIAQKVAEELKQIKKRDLMNFYRKYFKKSKSRRFKLNGWSSAKFKNFDDVDTSGDVDIDENSKF